MSGNFRTFEKVCGEKCAERIIRRALHDPDLTAETPGEVYDAAVRAALMESAPGFGDIRNIERMHARKEARWHEVMRRGGPAAKAFLHRLDVEMGVLDWAVDELREIVRNKAEKMQGEKKHD
jgi:hypothetical protein